MRRVPGGDYTTQQQQYEEYLFVVTNRKSPTANRTWSTINVRAVIRNEPKISIAVITSKILIWCGKHEGWRPTFFSSEKHSSVPAAHQSTVNQIYAEKVQFALGGTLCNRCSENDCFWRLLPGFKKISGWNLTATDMHIVNILVEDHFVRLGPKR